MTIETPTLIDAEAGATPADPVAAARAEVQRLHEVERSWSTSRDARATTLAGLEAGSGDAVLAAGTPEALADVTARILILRAEIETIDRAIEAARSRRAEAILAVYQVEAAEWRSQAVELRVEADEREPHTLDLLAELEAWEDCLYVPSPAPSRDVVLAAERANARVEERVSGRLPSPADQGPVDVPTVPLAALVIIEVPTPRTQRLRNAAADLLERARGHLDGRGVPRHGSAEGDVDDLVAAVLADPMNVGPLVRDVRAWAAEAERTVSARLRATLERFGDEVARREGWGRPIRFRLAWSRSAIDRSESEAYVVRDAAA